MRYVPRILIGCRENCAPVEVMSYTRSLSQGWFVASTVAGLPHYVHILNLEDVHANPNNQARVQVVYLLRSG